MSDRTVANIYRDLNHAIAEGKKKAIREAAKIVHKATLDELRAGSPGHGRAYKRGRRAVHRASRPGQAPARDTGTLIRAVAMEFHDGPNPKGIVGVKANANYARYLDPEPGQAEPRMGRRPFLSKAVRDTERQVQAKIRDELDAALRRVL